MKTSLKIASLSVLLLGATAPLFTGCSSTPTRESTGEYVDDATLTTKVKAAFVNDSSVKARDINVETFKGTVQLSGFADSADMKARAGQLAAGVAGVREVQNNITIK